MTAGRLELLCVTTTALFFAAAPPRETALDGGTYTRGCGYRDPARTLLGRIGEVWTSPRKESPRRGPRSQQGPCRQGLKLIPAAAARLKMLEDCGPLWGAALTPEAGPGAQLDQTRRGTCDRPGSGSQARRALTRALLCSRAPTRSQAECPFNKFNCFLYKNSSGKERGEGKTPRSSCPERGREKPGPRPGALSPPDQTPRVPVPTGPGERSPQNLQDSCRLPV